MDVVVYGAGSLGSLIGGLLARQHRVTLVGRDQHVATIQERGLRIGGAIEETVRPSATADGTDLQADLAVVTVKAFDTETAARELATGEFAVALPLSNGMGNEAVLAEHLSCPVLAAVCTYGAVHERPGRVDCTGEGEVVLGPREGGSAPEADRVGAAFRDAGVQTVVAEDMPRRLWEKLAVNAGINAVTALARVENRGVLSGPGNDLARAAARETARVARREGVSLSNREALEALESVASATTDNVSSMYQDVGAARRTEVDAINGYVLDCAREHDLAVPVNRTLTQLLRTWEEGRGLR